MLTNNAVSSLHRSGLTSPFLSFPRERGVSALGRRLEHHRNESRYAFAVFKSVVSKPSLKRSYTDCKRLRASAVRPWSCCKRARLVDVRSSHDRAPCSRATSSAAKKQR